MIIREANKFDLPYFIDLIHRINDKDELGDVVCAELDDKHLNSIFATVLAGAGICYIAESDNRIGIILGIISPNMWAPHILVMNQILYYVEEEYRHTRAGYLLFKKFDQECERLVEQKRFHQTLISVPKSIIDMDLERFDYELLEKSWVKKGVRYG